MELPRFHGAQVRDLHCRPISLEREAELYRRYRASLSEIGFDEAESQGAGFVHFYVGEDVQLPNGQTVLAVPLSRAFRSEDEARAELENLLPDHPGATVGRSEMLAQAASASAR